MQRQHNRIQRVGFAWAGLSPNRGEWLGRAQIGHRVGVEDRQAFQRLQIDLRRVDPRRVIRPVRPGDKLRRRATAHVGS